MTLVLQISGHPETYSIINFGIEFEQVCDKKGQPQSETVGGTIFFVIDGVSDPFITHWMFSPYARKNGVFSFRLSNESSPLVIEFENAYCIDYSQTTSFNQNPYTKLVISAQIVKMNGRDHRNDWE
ncbi:type VI secretion system tube protein TssD [Porphyromonas macacae]|uniref:type VI secretion system tube protein TssD n=1 Tax=Porphyromonas macacae TaxID=28115 RepID=UPI001269D7AB|nr:type VI secretion system tube protein TssD [Porphyromonas macacae]